MAISSGESVKDAATPKATSSQEVKEAKGKLVELLCKKTQGVAPFAVTEG